MKYTILKKQCTLVCLTHDNKPCVAEEGHPNACMCLRPKHNPEVQRKNRKAEISTGVVACSQCDLPSGPCDCYPGAEMQARNFQ